MSGDSTISVDGPSTFRGAVLFLVVGLAMTGFGAYDYLQQSDAMENAVSVDAEMTEVGVESDSAGSSTDVEYTPTVEFSYTYEGESYTSTNLYPAETTPSYDTRSAARDAVADYDEGATVTAYVSPDQPGNAFLKNEKSNSPLLFAGIGLFFVLVGGKSTLTQYGGS
ncbi:DUF3592 domain-containing protein [Haloarchaeobius sp. DYHT-AS-18]|uniref:DUF3592 domain-containing protein n=1 Tax=Haloarchaeobius sp. DYHT-AS-18 TaxID=3446117 RepID=UPI003EC12299